MACASTAGAGGWLATASCSKRAPTLRVRRRLVSTAGPSPSGRKSDSNVRARRYGNKDPIFAMTHSYSGVHRSGIISATGLRVCRRLTAHRQGKNRGARTSPCQTTRTAAARGHEHTRRWRQYSSAWARTRACCSSARIRLPSASVSPTVAAEHSAVLLPPLPIS